MKIRKILAMLTACVCMLPLMTACQQKRSQEDPAETTTAAQADTVLPEGCVIAAAFSADGVTTSRTRFFSADTVLGMTAPEGAHIYYTTDGSEPNTSSECYAEPLTLTAAEGNFPTVLVLKAKAVFADGTESKTATQTFICGKELEKRYQTLVVSLSGDPADLTESPNGILCGENYEQRGKESERAVYVEMFGQSGDLLMSQGAGVRIFGAYSRQYAIKSLKLYARRSYDEEHGKFRFENFGTVGADGEPITKYDKLVLRSSGNDFQFAYIRDELNQTLAAQAGYTDCEAVVPALVYLNGEYYAVMWIHETYCDDLLKAKYGGKDGKYVILEGSDREKKVSETDADEAMVAESFNDKYQMLSSLDLTNDENYAQVTAFMDVENYLQNFAFNFYICNADWPQNNFKCYRYFAAGGEECTTPQTDGRWRFLIHDTDYCMGIYEEDATKMTFNPMEVVLDEENERYSPMFAKLMEREDCRQYFVDEMERLMDGALSEQNMVNTLDEMDRSRMKEMRVYYEVLDELRKQDHSLWSTYGDYTARVAQVRMFARRRCAKMERFLIETFGLPEDYFAEPAAETTAAQ